MDYSNLYHNYKNHAKGIFGRRFLPLDHLEKAIGKLSPEFKITVEGFSELGKPIKSINFGNGKRKILIWSQMHGNETTTTKSLLDTLRLLSSQDYSKYKERLVEQCSFKIIPMLNPDGANEYTRVNANHIDLNRDAINRSQKETQVFFGLVQQFKPHFCFNMHGQRTIFSAGKEDYPATMSFLAPSYNHDCAVNSTRMAAMQLITIAFGMLSKFIPHQIARYDDAFNENCFGDNLTKQGIPTILFEAGHFQGDYSRDMTRRFVSMSLIAMLLSISSDDYKATDYKKYFELPENEKLYLDVILKNTSRQNGNALGILYKEVLMNGQIVFKPVIEAIEGLENTFAHKYIDAQHKSVIINNSDDFKIGDTILNLKIDDQPLSELFI